MRGTTIFILNSRAIRAVVFVSLLLPAVVFPAFKSGAQSPIPASGVDPHFYDYDSTSPIVSTEVPLKTEDGIRISTVTFPSPVVTPTAVNNTVTAYLFLPPGPGPHPAMVVLHEWLPVNFNNEFLLCKAIARNNIAALMVVQPYSANRRPMPRTPDAELLSGNIPQMVGGLRQAILDARRGLDWLAQRPDIDPNRLGTSGISLGGVLAPLLAGVDRRVKVVLGIVGGADVADIVWTSPFTSKVRKEAERRGYTYQTAKAALAPLESANWLHGFDSKNALLFDGRYDIFVTPKEAEDLAAALGGAHVVWSNTGHYGLALSMNEAYAVGGKFLQARFFPDTASNSAGQFVAPDTLPSRTIKLGWLIGGQEGVSPAIAYQMFNFDDPGRYSIDGQLTFHGLSAALSARIDVTKSIGLEFPLLHGHAKPHPFFLWHFVP